MKMRLSFILIFLVFIYTSCKNDPQVPNSNIDKKAMFTNYADNLIIPAYTNYGIALTALQNAATNLTNSANLTTLEATRNAFLTAYSSWIKCEAFDKTEPADALQALMVTNSYPTRNDSIEAYILRGETSLSSIGSKNNHDKGLPAIEYLIFSRTLSDNEIIERFESNSYKAYLLSLIQNLKNIQNSILSDWTNSYREQFINSLGTDAASSFSTMVNSIANFNDEIKRKQIGIPAGYQGNVSTPTVKPKSVQAYYSNQSINLLLLSLNNLKDVMNGKGTVDGIGLQDYIETLNYTSVFGGDLADEITVQIEKCILKVGEVGDDYSLTVSTNKPKADELFLEIKKLLVLLKVDLPSALGVSISYSDNDGD